MGHKADRIQCQFAPEDQAKFGSLAYTVFQSDAFSGERIQGEEDAGGKECEAGQNKALGKEMQTSGGSGEEQEH